MGQVRTKASLLSISPRYLSGACMPVHVASALSFPFSAHLPYLLLILESHSTSRQTNPASHTNPAEPHCYLACTKSSKNGQGLSPLSTETTTTTKSTMSYQPPASGNNAADTAAGIDATSRTVVYKCGDCDGDVPLKRGEPIRCKNCGHRVLYKQRTNR